MKTIDALRFTTTYVYDAAHRLLSVEDPSGGISTTVYDYAGNVARRSMRWGIGPATCMMPSIG